MSRADSRRSLPSVVRESARNIFPVALAFALLIGAIEAATAAFQMWGLHQLTWVAPDFLWMAPLANLLVFLPVALAFLAAATLLRRPFPLPWAIGSFEFLCVAGLLLPMRETPTWLDLVVALGLAVVIARQARAVPAQWHARMRALSLGLAAVVGLAALAAQSVRTIREARAMASVPAAASGAPNVLLVILDGVRSRSLSLYGYARRTSPELERIASEGVAFERAIAPGAFSLSSHAAMFTGQRSGSLNVGWYQPLSPRPGLLTEELRRRGYRTGGFVSNLLYASFESGLARGFIHYDDFPRSLSLILLHSPLSRAVMPGEFQNVRSRSDLVEAIHRVKFRGGRVPANIERPASDVTDHFLAWQRSLGSDRPFFAFINYIDAHEPYHAPDAFRTRFAAAPAPMDRYDGTIAYLDREVGRLVDGLRAEGVLDRTILVVTSDHGELFGEHGLHGHANSLYLPVLEVPLVLRYPARIPAGTRVAQPVSLLDLPATILALSGGPGLLPGGSFESLWGSNSVGALRPPISEMIAMPPGDLHASGRRNARTWLESILDDRFHFVRDGLGGEELFDYREDPGELANLVDHPATRPQLQRLRAALDSAVRRAAPLQGH